MIKCPECGQEASDDAKFCDRCGQGLTGGAIPIVAIEPLNPGTQLKKGEYRIIDLIARTSDENRYRAERTGERGIEFCELRERPGPHSVADPEHREVEPDAESAGDTDIAPTSPTAKTAELRLRDQAAGSNGASPAAADPEPETESHAAQPSEPDQTEDASTASEQAHAATLESATLPVSMPGPATLEQVVVEEQAGAVAVDQSEDGTSKPIAPDDLGEVFGRVMALSLTLAHPALYRAQAGFASGGRVYLVYPDEKLLPLTQRLSAKRMTEGEALNLGVQLCQVVAYFHRRALRVNDLCPDSVVFDLNGRLKLTGLDYVSNDDELLEMPIFNDGYTAPEIYRGKKVDKRADIFSIGALLYTCLTGARLEAESWREEAGPVGFYPAHVLTPAFEQIIRRAISFEPSARFANVDELKGELIKLASMISIRAAALTDVGMVRALNEDSVMTFEFRQESLVHPDRTFLYVVADGMGGAEAGEIASAIAVDTIRTYVAQQHASTAQADLAHLLQEALEEANRKVLDYAASHPEARGLGSTVVAAMVAPPEATIAWVGDSRVYLRQDGQLKQLSKDHSLVQRLIEIGQITAEEARHHEHKNVITRSLGARANGPAGAEALPLFRLRRGDRMLLCSDGLTTHVEDDHISEIIGRHQEPLEAARELIVAANAGGGTDNVSVVVIFAD